MSVTYDQKFDTEEANKEIARSYVQKVFNEHRLDRAAEFCAPEIKWYGGNLGTVEGFENVTALVRGFIGALPDLNAAEQEVAVMGDIVAIRYVVEGTHKGNLLGFSATGRHVRWNAIDWYRISNGKIVEEYASDDILKILADLGAYTSPWMKSGNQS